MWIGKPGCTAPTSTEGGDGVAPKSSWLIFFDDLAQLLRVVHVHGVAQRCQSQHGRTPLSKRRW